MNPDEILTLLKEATNTVGDISVKSTNYGMSLMDKTLLRILLNIPYNQMEATHTLSGLVAPSGNYRT